MYDSKYELQRRSLATGAGGAHPWTPCAILNLHPKSLNPKQPDAGAHQVPSHLAGMIAPVEKGLAGNAAV